MGAVAEELIRGPDDISVVGFDDTLAARITVPQLASVRQPLQEMGCKAVEVLLQKIDAVPDASKSFVFPTRLAPRGSLAAPKARPRVEKQKVKRQP